MAGVTPRYGLKLNYEGDLVEIKPIGQDNPALIETLIYNLYTSLATEVSNRNTAISTITQQITNLSGSYVPLTRKINSKQLNADIDLTYDDVGAAASSHSHAASTITGTLGVTQGGTGQTTLAALRNAMGLGNSTSTLAVGQGGTGTTSFTVNSVLLGNTTGALITLPAASGALYSTGANVKPAFGTLQQGQGGTGATTYAGAFTNIVAPGGTITGAVTHSGTMTHSGKTTFTGEAVFARSGQQIRLANNNLATGFGALIYESGSFLYFGQTALGSATTGAHTAIATSSGGSGTYPLMIQHADGGVFINGQRPWTRVTTGTFEWTTTNGITKDVNLSAYDFRDTSKYEIDITLVTGTADTIIKAAAKALIIIYARYNGYFRLRAAGGAPTLTLPLQYSIWQRL